MGENEFLFIFSSLAIRLEGFEFLPEASIGDLYSCAIFYYPIYIGGDHLEYKDGALYLRDSYSKFHKCDGPVNMENLLIDDYLIGSPGASHTSPGYSSFSHTNKGIGVVREKAKELMSGGEESLIAVLGEFPAIDTLNKIKEVSPKTFKLLMSDASIRLVQTTNTLLIDSDEPLKKFF